MILKGKSGTISISTVEKSKAMQCTEIEKKNKFSLLVFGSVWTSPATSATDFISTTVRNKDITI